MLIHPIFLTSLQTYAATVVNSVFFKAGDSNWNLFSNTIFAVIVKYLVFYRIFIFKNLYFFLETLQFQGFAFPHILS